MTTSTYTHYTTLLVLNRAIEVLTPIIIFTTCYHQPLAQNKKSLITGGCYFIPSLANTATLVQVTNKYKKYRGV